MMKLGLGDLEAVIAVAKRRNFRAAALDVGVSPTVLSQRIAAVEAKLGVRLFNRTTRSVTLTAVGSQFIEEVEPAVGRIGEAVDNVNEHRDTPNGVVRINCSVGAAQRILSPVLLEFARRNPGIEVDLVTEDRPIDIVAEGFDAGVRPTNTVPTDMIALQLEPEERFSVVGAPAYFKGRSAPLTPNDLLQHRCIRARLPSGGIERWEFVQDGRTVRLDVPGQITLDDAGLMLEAALAGTGLAYLAAWWTAESIRKGKLIRLLEGFTPSSSGLSLYYPSRRYQPAGLLALTRFISQERRTRRSEATGLHSVRRADIQPDHPQRFASLGRASLY